MLILFLVFWNTFCILTLGRFLSIKGVFLNTLLNYTVILALLVNYTYNIYILNNVITVDLINIIPVANFGITFDKVSISLLLPVIVITFFVNIYTRIYLEGDSFHIRFFGYLNLFSAFMTLLVLANNVLLLFFSWEGIGIASFLLIGYYYNSSNSIKSSLSAFYINKIGDLFLILGVILITYNINDVSNLLGFSLIIAATTKSAQFPFFKWLPESMCAPTPVSSLLHAATLVTAGVYLLVKTWFLLDSNINFIILLVGVFTTAGAGGIAVYQNDIKRIIAFSTCSQIAMCFVAIGLCQYSLALYHLFNHSFYKALLFLSAGVIIHAMKNVQDIRLYGSLNEKLPITQICFLIAGLSLMAIPGLTGFYSKDLIIESSIVSVLAPLVFFSGLLTAAYTISLYIQTFLVRANALHVTKLDNGLEKESLLYTIPLVLLALASIFIGYLTSELHNSLIDEFNISNDYEFMISWWSKSLILLLTLVAILYNSVETSFTLMWGSIRNLSRKIHIDLMVNIVTLGITKMAYHLNNTVEQGFIKKTNENLFKFSDNNLKRTYLLGYLILIIIVLV